MRNITKKVGKLNLVLNTLEPHETDITLKKATFVILDFEKSGNNVVVEKEVALNSLAPTIINKPIRGYYIQEDNNYEQNFGGHEVYLSEDKDGNEITERNTVPMGVFTSEGYIGEIEVDGVTKEVLLADAVLWYSQFIEPIDLMVEWYEQGITIPMSCEYIYYNTEFRDKVEYHLEPLYFEAHCVLGKDITPAYETAKLVSYNQLNQFKQLVAQLAKNESEKEELILTIKKRMINEVELDKVKEDIAKAIPVEEGTEAYTVEVYQTYAVVVTESDVEGTLNYVYWTVEYSIVDDEVVVNLDTLTIIEEDTVELDTSEKEQLNLKLEEADSQIAELKIKIEELEKFKSELNEIKRKEKFNELSNKFEKAFNNAKAKDTFKSEEVQTLLIKALDDQESLLSLNMMVVELLSTSVEVESKKDEESALLAMNSIRKDLLKENQSEEDEFNALFKK